jgi:hypothetical protein
LKENNMANQGNHDGHSQSIGGESDSPVDGIRGTHAGGIEPAGDDVNAGALGDVKGRRKEGSEQQGQQGNKQSVAEGDQDKGPDLPGGEAGTVGTQGPGGAQQGGNFQR